MHCALLQATSALDASNQSQVLQHLLAKCQAATVIMIGHNPRQLAGCTRLINLDRHARIVKDERVDPVRLPTIVNGDGDGSGRGDDKQQR